MERESEDNRVGRGDALPLLPIALALFLSGCATAPWSTTSDPGFPDYGSLGLEVDAEDGLYSVADAVPGDPDELWTAIRDGFSMPDLDTPEVARFEQWYAARGDFLDRMFHRARRYLPFIVDEIRARDMPMELALLPAVESAYVPTARSHASAVGLWQFIPATGRRYGLAQTQWYDGRRDVVASTGAALDYLQFLANEFEGDWFLALAGYNAGENRVARAVLANRSAGRSPLYQDLRLPAETRRYVPQLLALRNIIADPERFGVTLPHIPNEPYFAVVTLDRPVDLDMAAQISGVTRSEFQSLNAGYLRSTTGPGGPHRLLVPVEQLESLQAGLPRLPAVAATATGTAWGPDTSSPSSTDGRYTVRRGDTLGSIAARHGVTVSALQRSNNLRSHLIHPGQHLRVPGRGSTVAQGGGDWSGQYRVQRGDTLGAIASRHRVGVDALRQANGIRGNTIYPGQTLRVPGAAGSTTVAAATRPATYRVQRGDSLGGIGRRFGVSVDSLRAANNLRGTVIHPGQELRIPGGGAAATVASSAGSGWGGTYTVRRGDNLGAIASRHGVSVADLRTANNLRGTTIYPSQQLRVPGGAASTASAAPATAATYTVRRGDTLGSIASRHGTTVDRLRSANNLRGTTIHPGQELRVPGAATAAATSSGPTTYTVRSGDTLGGIAHRHGVTPDLLRSANGIRGNLIHPGQRLTIPGGATQVAAAREPIVHLVARGDTLWDIARRYQVPVRDLATYNAISVNQTLRLGQELRVPVR